MKEQTYEEAMKQLEKITSQIESGELDIDHFKGGILCLGRKFCKDKLYKTDENVQKILESVTNK